jgi:serine/threonine protein kinase
MDLNGRYRLEQPLNRGLAEVWRATDLTLGRPVAVKVMPALGAEAVAAGRRAVQAAAMLQHPSITIVHDIGEHDGRLFVVMELLSGRDLEQVLRESTTGLTPDRAAAIGARIADALAAAHASGIVHRGLKLSNTVLLTGDQVKVRDFGTAKITQSAADSLGAMAGSPAFMAPEQFSGDADHRTDLYALGCVLYALATGNPPFGADEPWPALMYQQLSTEPVDPRTHKADLPAEFADLVRALLAKEPDQRPQSAAEVAKQLSALSPAAGSEASASQWALPGGGPLPTVAATVVVPAAQPAPAAAPSDQLPTQLVEPANAEQAQPEQAQPDEAQPEQAQHEQAQLQQAQSEPALAESSSAEPPPADSSSAGQPLPAQVQLTPPSMPPSMPPPTPEPADAAFNSAFAAPTPAPVSTPFAPGPAPMLQAPLTASISHGRAVQLMQRATQSVGRVVESEKTLAALCAVIQNFAAVDVAQAQTLFDSIEVSPVPNYDSGGDAQVARLLAALATGLGPTGPGAARGMLDEAAGFARNKALNPHAAALALSAVAAPSLWYDRARARDLLTRAERQLTKIPPGRALDEALKAVAIPFASLDAGFAGQIAVGIADPALAVSAHVRVADRIVRQAPAYAISFLNIAQQRLTGITDPRVYEARAADIAVRFAGIDFSRAQQLIPAADEDRNRLHSARVLTALATASLRWDPVLAATYMDSATHDAMATLDDIDRSRALAGVGAALAPTAPDRARDLLSEAHKSLHDVADPHRRAYALCHLVACGLGVRPDDGWNAGAES